MQKLIDRMVALQVEHQKRASTLMREKFSWVFEEIEELEEHRILAQFSEYCDILPIVSFNGQRYDIPLI